MSLIYFYFQVRLQDNLQYIVPVVPDGGAVCGPGGGDTDQLRHGSVNQRQSLF